MSLEVLIGSSKTWQRKLNHLSRLRLCREGGWDCQLESALDARHVDEVERQSRLTDGFDTPLTVLVTQSQQCVGLTHARPGQWASEQAFCEEADVQSVRLGLGQQRVNAPEGIVRFAHGIIVDVRRARASRLSWMHLDAFGAELDLH